MVPSKVLGEGMELPTSPKFQKYLIKNKFLQRFPLFVLAPDHEYSSKVTILHEKLPIILFLFVQILKHILGTSLKYRGLNAHFSSVPPKLRIIDPPNPRPSLRL